VLIIHKINFVRKSPPSCYDISYLLFPLAPYSWYNQFSSCNLLFVWTIACLTLCECKKFGLRFVDLKWFLVWSILKYFFTVFINSRSERTPQQKNWCFGRKFLEYMTRLSGKNYRPTSCSFYLSFESWKQISEAKWNSKARPFEREGNPRRMDQTQTCNCTYVPIWSNHYNALSK